MSSQDEGVHAGDGGNSLMVNAPFFF